MVSRFRYLPHNHGSDTRESSCFCNRRKSRAHFFYLCSPSSDINRVTWPCCWAAELELTWPNTSPNFRQAGRQINTDGRVGFSEANSERSSRNISVSAHFCSSGRLQVWSRWVYVPFVLLSVVCRHLYVSFFGCRPHFFSQRPRAPTVQFLRSFTLSDEDDIMLASFPAIFLPRRCLHRGLCLPPAPIPCPLAALCLGRLL